jgi:hypothetical protein
VGYQLRGRIRPIRSRGVGMEVDDGGHSPMLDATLEE